MHKIIWDIGLVSMLTNSIDATTHKHWMLQLFFLPKGSLNLTVNGHPVSGQCILVNTNCDHTFCTSEDLHFSMLITPGTSLCDHLVNTYINDAPYYDFSSVIEEKVTRQFEQFRQNPSLEKYLFFKKELLNALGVQEIRSGTESDDRINEVIQILTADNFSESNYGFKEPHSIDELAKTVALSPSRLAHLFKEETGVPLKSYLVLMKVFTAFWLLLKGISITEAAMNAGFDSPSHLASTIKGMVGSSATFAIKDSEFLKVPLK